MSLYPIIAMIGLAGIAIAAILVARVRAQHDEREIEGALEVLRTLRWKEFAQLVTQSFASRGFKLAPSQRTPGEGGVDFVLERAGVKHLLQIKHGGAYHVGAPAVRTMIGMLDSREAKGGLLVTSGRFDQSAQDAARGQHVTLVDGAALWKEMRPLISGAMREDAERRADDKAREANKRNGLVGVIGLILLVAGGAGYIWQYMSKQPGLINGTVASTPRETAPTVAEERPVTVDPPARTVTTDAPTPPPAEVPAPAATLPATATDPTIEAPAMPATPAPTPPGPMPELTESELAMQRNLSAAEALLVDGVASATWPSRSTMLVTLRQKDPPNRAEILDAVCKRVTSREALRFTRLQVTTFGVDPSTPGSTRWFQCR